MNNELRDTVFYSEIRAIELLDSMYKEENNNDQEKIKEYAKQIFAILKRDDLYEYTIKHELINTVLLYSSIGYIGGCVKELKEWYEYNKYVIISDDNETSWDRILTCKLYECWLYLFKDEKTEEVLETVKNLRSIQGIYETELMEKLDAFDKERMVYYLIGCYHMAKVVELIAQHKTGVIVDDIIYKINVHFEYIKQCVFTGGFFVRNYCIPWLQAAAVQMVKDKKKEKKDEDYKS